MKLFKVFYCYIALALFVAPLAARDALLEVKAAYFLATNSCFKDMYGHGGGLYGAELSVQLCDQSHWYGFASADYFDKEGRSLGLCDATKVSLLPVALGLKYFVPFCNERADFYVGLGFQPVQVKTTNCSEFVIQKQARWALGGIAKTGVYYYLPCNFLIDFFVDYSFASISCKDVCCGNAGPVVPVKANVSGAIFGAGLGYKF